MLDQLFGSRTRVKLLRLFLTNPEIDYFVRELTRKVNERINSVRRELENLEVLGLVQSHQNGQKKFYRTNTNFVLYPELKNLILKSQMTLERSLAQSIKSIGQISYLVLTGVFTGVPDGQTDILIVGKVNRTKLTRLVNRFHRDFDKKIRYTVMTRKEFDYRNSLTDKFLYHILENPKIVITDSIFTAT
ncbi:MAG: winged helix-turn-helix domain-containing protein [Patescibacteria group bacterium]